MEHSDLQDQIDEVFKEGSNHISPAFRDFDPRSEELLHDMLEKFIEQEEAAHQQGVRLAASQLNKKRILSAVSFAKRTISANEGHSRLVKIAFAIFLTHNKAAQQLGVFPSPLKDHSEFQIEPEAVPDSVQFQVPETVQLRQVPEFKSSKLPTVTSHRPTTNPVTADTLSGMETLRYWRDDYDLNDHHHHWHIVYPWSGVPKKDKNGKYVKDEKGKQVYTRVIDRQGELFLYMHSQMLARYNAERLSWNSLGLVDPWTYDQLVEPGYTPPPSLRDRFGARPPLQGWLETSPSSLPNSKSYDGTTENMTKWRNNINKAIINGYFVTKKSDGSSGKLHLTEDNAMNWVGLAVEAASEQLKEVEENSGEFVDGELYGALHNLGHDKFSMIGYQEYTGPTNRLGVMGFVEAAVRDPVFWIWHRHVDQFRQSVIKKYKQHDLKKFAPKKVKLVSIKILPNNSDTTSTPSGGVTTYLSAPRIKLHEVNAKLQHEPYKWEIEVETQLSEDTIKRKPHQFTVRIFIAPKDLMHQQHRWIEMDKFKHSLSKTKETIIRLDVESSVARKPNKGGTDPRCLCGWPQNMMLPNGTAKGTDYIAFAMLTDKDELSDDTTHSVSFCGARDDKYPDKRGMGYPFDKLWFNNSSEFHEGIEGLDNIKLYDFKIYSERELFQGTKVAVMNVTWENTIKRYFNKEDKKKFMTKEYGHIDLSKKEDVVRYRMFIYAEFEEKDKSYGKVWGPKEKATYIGWIQAGYP